MTSATTTERLLRLLSLLQSRGDWPGTVLADRLEISHRTVRRDVERLRELGYSIRSTMGPDGGYRLDAGEQLPPLLFDDEQAIAVAVALQGATSSGVGIEDGANRALATVRQVMPSRLRHRLDAIRFTTMPGTSTPVPPAVLLALSAAVRDGQVLRFDYDGGEEPAPPRRVEPHHLVTAQGRWYLVAWDLDRGDWRTFRADRITPRAPAGARFAPRQVPGGDVRTYLAARFAGSESSAEPPCRGTVMLWLPASAVVPFAGDGIVEDLGGDRCTLELSSWSWGALAASFGRFEARMQVLGPTQLTEAFTALGARFAAATER